MLCGRVPLRHADKRATVHRYLAVAPGLLRNPFDEVKAVATDKGPIDCDYVVVGAGPWVPVALGAGATPRGMLVVTVEQEDELRAFCNLIARRTPGSRKPRRSHIAG